ncbi:MAG: sugar phosphate isomerase/epimerase [Lachnospiraceae bacterium]|nr:sugar phosphate isomerase/epimerase [Lachnospiraceae bacterium]
MKLSASTVLYQEFRGTDLLRDMNEVLRVMRQVGYEVADINLGSQEKANYMLRGEDWQQQVDQVANTAAKLGMEFYQCHMPYIPGCAPGVSKDWKTPGYPEYFRECMRRASIANGMLGVKWAVYHPIYCPEENYERKAALDANHALYDEYIDLCIKNGTGVAYENMLPSLKRVHPVRYGTHYEDLTELIDSYRDPQVGACWDTGHANQMKLEQGRAIRALGDRLKVLHISDCFYGVRDEHLLPYMGTVDWNAVLEALVEIGYQGTLNYETGKVTKKAAGEMQLELVKMCYRNGLYLLDMYEQTKKKAEEKAGCQA